MKKPVSPSHCSFADDQLCEGEKTKPAQASPMNCMGETMKNSIHIEPTVKVEAADEWSRLFERYDVTETTWIGADGIYSFPLDGNDAFASATDCTKTFFIFSDTLFGTASKTEKKPCERLCRIILLRSSKEISPMPIGADLSGARVAAVPWICRTSTTMRRKILWVR